VAAQDLRQVLLALLVRVRRSVDLRILGPGLLAFCFVRLPVIEVRGLVRRGLVGLFALLDMERVVLGADRLRLRGVIAGDELDVFLDLVGHLLASSLHSPVTLSTMSLMSLVR
jgi:hypothetical protein